MFTGGRGRTRPCCHFTGDGLANRSDTFTGLFLFSGGRWTNRTPYFRIHGFQDRLPTIQRHLPFVHWRPVAELNHRFCLERAASLPFDERAFDLVRRPGLEPGNQAVPANTLLRCDPRPLNQLPVASAIPPSALVLKATGLATQLYGMRCRCYLLAGPAVVEPALVCLTGTYLPLGCRPIFLKFAPRQDSACAFVGRAVRAICLT